MFALYEDLARAQTAELDQRQRRRSTLHREYLARETERAHRARLSLARRLYGA